MPLTVCPLCDEPVDEDEGDEPVPVWTQEPPQQTARYLKATAPKTGEYFYGGRTVGELGAVLEALKQADRVEVDTSDRVREVRGVGSEDLQTYAAEPGGVSEPVRLEAHAADGKAGATVVIEPPDAPEPDEIMHRMCHEKLFGDNHGN